MLGFAGPLILLLSFATRLDLGLEAPWYLLSLVSVGYVPWLAVALACAWLPSRRSSPLSRSAATHRLAVAAAPAVACSGSLGGARNPAAERDALEG